MSAVGPAQLRTASRTDVGRTRSENQDACGEFQGPSGARLLAVADGMGGHQGGATASRITIETLGEVFVRDPDPSGETLREAFETANARVYQAAQEHPELHGMGTTCVALLFGTDGTAWVAHVGDSRAYLLRDGQLDPLTADHSTVGELVRAGKITPEEAAVHPRRNEILRSIGADTSVEVDVAPVEMRAGDQYLLCSDGLSGLVSDPEMGAVLLREGPEEATRTLVDLANERGGPDNVTVVVTAVPGHGQPDDGAAAASWAVDETRALARRRVQWIAAAAAAIAALLAISLILLIFTTEEIAVGDSRRESPPLADDRAAGADVTVPTPSGLRGEPEP
jgi:serine/threonine protein phosphatase PrpC